MKKIFINNKGFTLVELIIAMGIFAMILLVTTQVFINAINLTNDSEILSQLQSQLTQAESKINSAGQVADCVTTGYTSTVSGDPNNIQNGDYCNRVVDGATSEESVCDPTLTDAGITDLIGNTKQDIEFYQIDPYTANSRNWSFYIAPVSGNAGELLYNEYSTLYQDAGPTGSADLNLPNYYLLGGQYVYEQYNLYLDTTNSGFTLMCPCTKNGGSCNRNNVGLPYVEVKLSAYFEDSNTNKIIGPLTVYGSINLNNSVIWN